MQPPAPSTLNEVLREDLAHSLADESCRSGVLLARRQKSDRGGDSVGALRRERGDLAAEVESSSKPHTDDV